MAGDSRATWAALGALLVAGAAPPAASEPAAPWPRPNVVLIVTDDQGYGDLGVTGNSRIRTPHIDSLARRSASMRHFYVSPVCSPTRASLMTGRYNYRTRVVDTFVGRSRMDTAEVTLAEVLRDAGYATGIFGKWHLGDNYPMRPQDQGFEESLVLRGGGLAQPSDPIENERRYTDPILFRNGRQLQSRGYCTDVYFEAAHEFIERSQRSGRSFFAYLTPNAPHDPFHDVPAGWLEHYRKQDLRPLVIAGPDGRPGEPDQDRLARTFAMVSNIDDNVGRLLERLAARRLTDDTIVVFMTDNGPASARYVGPFRSTKGDVHEGGVRSPFFVQWPAGLTPGTTSDVPVAHIDVLPTLLEACRVAAPSGVRLDGRSFLALLQGRAVDWPERALVIQSHRGDVPVLYNHFMIRGERYKLLNASGFSSERLPGPPQWELYDVVSDPGETENLAAARPEWVSRLRAAYEEWFRDVSSTREDNYAPPRIAVGTPHENPVWLTRQDWRHELGRPWAADSIGRWELALSSAGPYDVRLLFDAADAAGTARIEIGATSVEQPIAARATTCTFSGLTLPMGDTSLRAILTRGGDRRGIYQAELTAPPHRGHTKGSTLAGSALPRGTAAEPPIRLIVRGDDMGSSPASNEASIRCFKDGVMRDVELMAVGPWFPQAARLLRENPGIDVGLHLALTSEWDDVKWRPLTTAPSLVGRDGFFHPMVWPHPHYGKERALKEQPWKLDEIERELRAQIETTKREVPQLSHLSGHMGFQALGPEVAALVKRLAAEYRLDIDPEALGAKWVGWDGKPVTPAEKVESFTRVLEALSPGTWLFVDHPALDTPEMRATGHVGYEAVAVDRQGVTDAWTSPAARDIVARRGIELIGYRDLARK